MRDIEDEVATGPGPSAGRWLIGRGGVKGQLWTNSSTRTPGTDAADAESGCVTLRYRSKLLPMGRSAIRRPRARRRIAALRVADPGALRRPMIAAPESPDRLGARRRRIGHYRGRSTAGRLRLEDDATGARGDDQREREHSIRWRPHDDYPSPPSDSVPAQQRWTGPTVARAEDGQWMAAHRARRRAAGAPCRRRRSPRARSIGEYRSAHLPGAVNVPGRLSRRNARALCAGARNGG